MGLFSNETDGLLRSLGIESGNTTIAKELALDITPLLGEIRSAQSARKNYGEGNYGMAAVDALGAIPLIGAIPRVAKSGVKAIKSLSDLEKSGLADINTIVKKQGTYKHYKLKDGVDPKDLDLIPPPSAAQNTQAAQASTKGSYEKAINLLDSDKGKGGRWLDFGAGRGYSGSRGATTYEPFPRTEFKPDFTDTSKIPDNSFDKITNLNVLNVVPPTIRNEIVTDIGKKLAPRGEAIITTRGADVLDANGILANEPMSIITGRNTYQKGFTPSELEDYVSQTLGEGFEVARLKGKEKIGQAGVKVKKLALEAKEEIVDLNVTGFESSI
jgi:hypothetical protein